MSVPPDLQFEDRIAPYKDGFYFLCQRRGHKKVAVYLPGFKSDAKSFRAAHDTAYHNAQFRHLGFHPEKEIPLKVLFSEYLAYVDSRELAKTMDPQTNRHYHYMAEVLTAGMAAIGVRFVRELDPSKISAFVAWSKGNPVLKTDRDGKEVRFGSEGATVIKALSALKTMIRWKGLPVDWQIPTKEIDAKKKPKRDLDSATIRRFIAAMSAGSLEEAVVWLKARTGARDVEVYDARPEEFDLKAGTWFPQLRSKRKQKRHVYALTKDTIAILEPFVTAALKKRRTHLFELEGRKLNRDSLRRRFRKASALAQDEAGEKPEPIVPPIESIAPIRSEIVTLVADEESIEAAKDYVGHDDVETTLRFYYKNRVTAKKLEERRKLAEVLADAIPLRRVGGG